jgi:GNAT superfamily N-acetyltransferase
LGKIDAQNDAMVSSPCLLTDNHICTDFDCGHPLLNHWLKRYAMQNQRANSVKTFVVADQDCVAGYYSLAVGSIEHEIASLRTRKGLARHPIPVMILARLAVDLKYQGRKIGSGLLKDALLRTLDASAHAGIRAVFVHAKDEKAKKFYTHFDFEPSPIDPMKLMLLVKDIRRAFDTEVA